MQQITGTHHTHNSPQHHCGVTIPTHIRLDPFDDGAISLQIFGQYIIYHRTPTPLQQRVDNTLLGAR